MSSGRHVFISHSDSDSAWARQLSERLKVAGLEVWDPSTELLPGSDFSQEVSKALARSDALIVLVSPEAMKSDWVRREIQFALGEERFQARLVPVLVKPTPSSTIPWILRGLEWAKGSPNRVAERIVTLLRRSRSESRAQAG
jgi:hypothetical protein